MLQKLEKRMFLAPQQHTGTSATVNVPEPRGAVLRRGGHVAAVRANACGTSVKSKESKQKRSRTSSLKLFKNVF